MRRPSRNASMGLSLLAAAAGMLMLAYASVPLYRLFCQVTGFGGTPVRVESVKGKVAERIITVRFNADIDPALPWEFHPEEKEIAMRVGEQRLTAYLARNKSKSAVAGHATYNVVPDKAGAYFAKLECFCFKNQTLGGGQEVHMPVSFFIDPAIMDDPLMNDVKTITLSYTFFPAKE